MTRLLLSLVVLLLAHSPLFGGPTYRVYFGTYTRGDSQGIYFSNWNGETKTLSEPSLAGEVKNPSFLTVSADGGFLYAVSEVADFADGGAVSAFRIVDDGTLVLLNQQPSGGKGPCHVSLSPDGRVLGIANYSGGSVSSYLVDEDGSLSAPVSTIQHTGSSVDPKRQTAPHAHSINFSPDGRFAYAADLGTDRVYVYSVAEDGALVGVSEVALPGGSGPRHFAFHPGGKFAYVINEMTRTATTFSVDEESGALTTVDEVSTLPEDAPAEGSTAEIVAHPSGKFVYGSNRGHDTIAAFSVDSLTGALTRIENEPIRGETPRNFALTPDGAYLFAAGQNSNTVAVFSVDPESGELEFAGAEITVPNPVCVRFVPGE